MACPTCGHSMGGVGIALGSDETVFWCERCGTCVTPRDTYVPKLVGRCRIFEDEVLNNTDYQKRWHSLGIAESINQPGQRRV